MYGFGWSLPRGSTGRALFDQPRRLGQSRRPKMSDVSFKPDGVGAPRAARAGSRCLAVSFETRWRVVARKQRRGRRVPASRSANVDVDRPAQREVPHDPRLVPLPPKPPRDAIHNATGQAKRVRELRCGRARHHRRPALAPRARGSTPRRECGPRRWPRSRPGRRGRCRRARDADRARPHAGSDSAGRGSGGRVSSAWARGEFCMGTLQRV